METVNLDRTTLPVLYACDVVVMGGSLAGVSAALTMARAGRKVALVEPRTYLGREITATLRPWVRVPDTADAGTLPEVVAACIQASGTKMVAGEFPLHLDAVKMRLEDMLLERGVKLVYASFPVGLCTEDGLLQGVIIGNKSGRQVLTCQLLLDATATALATRFTGAVFQKSPESFRYTITLEFDGVAFQEESGMVEGVPELLVPPHLGIAGDKVITHRGYRPGRDAYNHGHVLVECALEMGHAMTALDITRRYVEARHRAFALASHLLWENHHFRLAYLGTLSQELHGPHTMPMTGPPPDWARSMDAVRVNVGDNGLPVNRFATAVVGVWCLNDAVRADLPARESIREPISASHLGGQLACVLDAHWQEVAAPRRAEPGPESILPAPQASRALPLRVKEPQEPQRGRRYERYPVLPSQVPIVADVDVLVVGGGTSGAIAAIVAAQEGMRTTVVEMNPGLGGTATHGGVKHYWAGWQGGFTAISREWVNKVHDQVRYPRTYGLVGGWNIEAKVQALTQEAQEAGADVLLEALAIGVIVADDAVRGVVVATPTGLLALLGKVVIDATGDGDIAAFAGAEFVYGSPRDHAVMWYSLPQIGAPGHTHNNFTSMVDVSNIVDYNRAILSGRRRGGRLHDHGIYVATRESRRIMGDAVQTLNDQLLQRCWPDVINIAVSNNDIKGQISSDWMRIGMISPNLEIESPYRILLPKGLENILVVGKAVSVTRDALPAIRMQPDFENQGGAAGLAAAMTVRSGRGLREIDVRALQARLVEIGALPERVLTRHLVPRQYKDMELRSLIEALVADERPFHTYSMMELNEVFRGRIPLVEICCAGPQVLPLLEQALRETEGSGKLRLAQALAILGSPAGARVLVDALREQLSGDRLPQRISPIKHVDKYSPDQAAMPDEAYLLYALGMTRDQRALPVWQRVVDLLAFAREEDVWSQAKGVFCYVDAVCFGAERLGDPAAIPLLRQLHSYPPFHHKELHSGFQADFLLERPAYLEVVIGRTLARCGSPDGVVILINYLDDVRGLLAEQAHDELIAVSGRDLGKDIAAWTQWLEMEGQGLKPVPWLEPTEPVAAWGETILTGKDPLK